MLVDGRKLPTINMTTLNEDDGMNELEALIKERMIERKDDKMKIDDIKNEAEVEHDDTLVMFKVISPQLLFHKFYLKKVLYFCLF